MNNDYYRTTYRRIGFPKPHSTIIIIILANICLFLIQILLPRTMIYHFALVPSLIRSKLYIWQFVSYMFLHGSFLHLFFNMFVLFIFGQDLIRLWGSKKFLSYYFFTGIGAGICSFLMTNIPTIGASGAMYGLLLAYGILFPNKILLIYLIIPMKAKYLVILFGIIELIASITSRADGIAHIAHLGGMLFGAFYLWIMNLSKKKKRFSNFIT